MDEQIDLARAERVGKELRANEETLAVAESCTGGLLGAAITAIPGSSEYFEAGLTTYAYGAKRQLLGVNRESLDEHGAVSEPVAREMAQGVRDVIDCTWGIGITGVAGPAGGTDATPVGTVFIGVAYAGPWGNGTSSTTVSRHQFDGDRTNVRKAAVESALELLREELETNQR